MCVFCFVLSVCHSRIGSGQALGYLSRHLTDEPKSPSTIVQLERGGFLGIAMIVGIICNIVRLMMMMMMMVMMILLIMFTARGREAENQSLASLLCP